ncbi:MAG: ribosome maturation factor RimP [Actinomycetota bacterium]|nr:ribosome maturation factor RimP [Actinomycetota bacterium]
MTQGIEAKLREIAQDPLADRGLELLDVELKSGSLRVTLDSETPLDLDRIADASSLISRLIDDSVEFDDMSQFNLEVSSPGLERRLRTEAHFRRFLGSKVSIKMSPEFAGLRRFAGVVNKVEDGSVTVKVDDSSVTGSQDLEVKIDEIERARTVFEWGPSTASRSKSIHGSKPPGKTKMTANKMANSEGRDG